MESNKVNVRIYGQEYTISGEKSRDWLLTEFMLAKDDGFRSEAKVALYCYDEAGFGSGVNTMRFLYENKPILGFYNPDVMQHRNINNIQQLQIHFPEMVTLVEYSTIDFVISYSEQWLTALSRQATSPDP